MSKSDNCMLCYPFDENRFLSWPKPVVCQPKLDGFRCLAHLQPQPDNYALVALETRGGKAISTVPHIESALSKLENLYYASGAQSECTFDGELMLPGESFEQLCSIVKRGSLHSDYKRIEYHIFDILTNAPQLTRCRQVFECIQATSCIKLVLPDMLSTLDDVYKKLAEYCELGYEGIILRRIDALYERKRSTSIMKLKPSKQDSYLIVDSEEEIDIYGVPKGTLGALVLRTMGSNELFNVGTGLTRYQRNVLWQMRETLPGKTAVVKYQQLTERRVPRFPVLLEVI